MDRVVTIVNSYMTQRDNLFQRNRMVNAGFALPETADPLIASKFATLMDKSTAELMAELPPMSPVQWESFIELVPNIKKLLVMGDS